MPTLSPDQDQHYVPEFLFAPWATAGKVECFGTIHGKMVCRTLPPSAFAFQTNLTSVLTLPPDKRHFIEDGFYSRLDSDAAQMHRKLIAMPRMAPLPERETRLWAVFLLSLVTRQPKTVAEGAEAFRRTSRRIMARRSKALRREAKAAGRSIKGDLESWARKNLPGLLEALPKSGVADQALDMHNVEAVRGTRWRFIERPPGCPEFLIGTRPLLLRKLGDFPFGQWWMILPISPDRAVMLATSPKFFRRSRPAAESVGPEHQHPDDPRK